MTEKKKNLDIMEVGLMSDLTVKSYWRTGREARRNPQGSMERTSGECKDLPGVSEERRKRGFGQGGGSRQLCS